MNGVFGMTDLLMRTELTERQRKFVGIISSSAKRLLTIINDILDLSRIESGKLELDSARFRAQDAASRRRSICWRARRSARVSSSASSSPAMCREMVSGRFRPAAAGAHQSRQQRDQVHATPAKSRSGSAASGRRTARAASVRGPRYRHRHSRGHPAAAVHAVPAGRHLDFAAVRRHRAWAVDLAAPGRVDGRQSRADEQGRRGHDDLVRARACRSAKPRWKPTQPSDDVSALPGDRVLVLDDRATNREVVQAYFADCGAQADRRRSSAKEAYEELCSAADAGEPLRARRRRHADAGCQRARVRADGARQSEARRRSSSSC